ncbi:MAG: Gfo/Idh/MocA family oxidoreductase [Chthoniobacterales bacterium]
MKKQRIAFAGIRHAHIGDLWNRAQKHPDLEIVACCEEDPKHSLLDALNITPTHDNFETMLSEVDFDILAIGDYYAKRGKLAIRGLDKGKHIISDKPVCTHLEELDRIEMLSREKNLKVGLMLDCRTTGGFIALRNFIRSGRIGEIVTVSVAGQHPLMIGVRPEWYFEPGKHGGTLNDIAIHALDFVPWMTGLNWKRIISARTWNAKAKTMPHFKDSAQFLMELENGAGVIGDMSYLAPNGCGFKTDMYWRLIFHGTCGFVEASYNSTELRFATDTDKDVQTAPIAESAPGQYLEDFLADIQGNPIKQGLSTAVSLRANRWALQLQQVADSSA